MPTFFDRAKVSALTAGTWNYSGRLWYFLLVKDRLAFLLASFRFSNSIYSTIALLQKEASSEKNLYCLFGKLQAPLQYFRSELAS